LLILHNQTQARFEGREYVITQPSDYKSESSHVESVLRAEYALLCIADAFKAEFDNNVKANKVGNVPSKLVLFTSNSWF
jgi:hypothetical protein